MPLAVGGSLLALTHTGGTLNIFIQIGMITLVGLITKHGILIVEFANQIQRRGEGGKLEAVLEVASLRLSPILMTTAAMVLGASPLALASGAGAEGRQQIGWARRRHEHWHPVYRVCRTGGLQLDRQDP